MTGVTGPTGPAVTANNLMMFGTSPGTIPNATVPVTVRVHQDGTAISPGVQGTINLAANQTYYVDYRTNANSTGNVAAALELDGGPGSVTGSNAVATSNGITQVLAGSAIISTGATAGNLRLRNDGPLTSNFGSTAINVIKLK
ncbi:hypothetical protein ACE41H_24820 [Paenibacillus enshidis]|uniref:BclA C-terminal domain-containing protein n=1 Tax=Paenibacillus enshidis TaxID=1458439 RepID=A0ABV5B0J3_9BACL